MFYFILAGGLKAHHTARANEALYDVARQTYLGVQLDDQCTTVVACL